MANRQIKNTNPGGLGTYIGANEQREHIFFPGGDAVTSVDEKKLAEARKDEHFEVHFERGLLVDVTAPAKAPAAPVVETKPAPAPAAAGGKAKETPEK